MCFEIIDASKKSHICFGSFEIENPKMFRIGKLETPKCPIFAFGGLETSTCPIVALKKLKMGNMTHVCCGDLEVPTRSKSVRHFWEIQDVLYLFCNFWKF